MNPLNPPRPLPPVCQSALDALVAGEIDGAAFVYYCNMTASALLDWALAVVEALAR